MSKLKVVFLDDSEVDFELVRDLYLRDIAEVIQCRTKTEFEKALKQDFDVCLIDLMLFGFSGHDAIKLSKAIKPDLPVIIVTGSVDGKQADEACEFGAERFFLKDSLVGLAKAVVDAHEKRKLKQEADYLKETLLKDNRHALLGETLAGFTHDFNNILSPLVTGPDVVRRLLQNHFSDIPENLDRVLSAMESAGHRGADMSKQLLAFVRGSNGSVYKIVTAEYLLTEIGNMLRDSFPKKITVCY